MRKRIGGGNEDRRLKVDGSRVGEMYRGGQTIKEIAERFGVSVAPIKRILHEEGVERRGAAPRHDSVAGVNNPAWKGGRRVRADGYVLVWTPHGDRLEHREIMEKHLGRPLLEDEIVHHKDGNRSNNAPSNLEVLPTHVEHMRLHAAENRSVLFQSGLKQCTRCLLIKPLASFYARRNGRIDSWCKDCKNKHDTRRRKKGRSSFPER